MGYYGEPVRAQKFVDNPLATVPPTTVQLLDWEVANMIEQMQVAPWDQLNTSQKRAVARMILMRRGDVTSKQQLDLLGINNPNYNTFEVITTDASNSPSGSLISHFLM